jgi:predicted transcriptional regulator
LERVSVSDADISSDVRQFLAKCIRSIEQLEILLLVRATPEQKWTVRELYQRVLTNETSILQSLERLREHGLVQQAGESTYQFVSSTDAQSVLEKLAGLYKEKPTRILQALYGSTQSEAEAFAQSFRIRRPE